MKKIVLLFSLFVSMEAMAQGIKTPAPSPTQTIKQDFALSSIEINYSRPLAKGRKIFGDLVPFGKMWRTGANGATKITFGEDVKVGGVAVKAGSYALYSIPSADEWEIIINTGVNNGGLNGYKTEEDVAHFKVKTFALPFAIESFTMMIGDVLPTSANIQILWENTAVSIPVEADIDSKIMKSIDGAMNVDNRPYFAAAGYYYDNGKDLSKALEWVSKAIDAQPSAYWMVHLKAKIQAKMGDKVAAKATALKGIELAKAGGNPDYVALNEKLIATL
jgi:Protein of unknown function (DUF2911)